MRALIVLLLAATLAGCVGDDAESPEPTQTTTDTTTEAPAPVNETVNTPPTASLVANTTLGEAPLSVNFTLGGTDGDGDNLTWTFDADADGAFEAEGTQLPASVVFNYTAAGLFNATFSVFDGINTTLANLTINATLPAAPAEPAFEPVTLSQDRALNCPHCILGAGFGASACAGIQAGENGVDCAWFELLPEWSGREWAIDGSLISFVEFYTDCGGADLIEATYESGATSGTIPEGAGCAVEWDPVDPVVTITLTIS